MRTFIDNKGLKKIVLGEISLPNNEITFGWSSLFAFLELNSSLENVSKFEIYEEILKNLETDISKEELIRLYEKLFVEILTQVQALPVTQAAYLIERIKSKNCPEFSFTLDHYENILTNDPSNALHDLTLYVAWDRMCIALAMIFEQSSSNQRIRTALATLQECLVESFQHITEQGRSVPSFFRLMEAFFAFQMREDNLQVHSDEEWTILCQGARALKSRSILPDAYYIDAVIIPEHEPKHAIKMFTTDSQEIVKSGEALALLTIRKIKKEYPFWKYALGKTDFQFIT